MRQWFVAETVRGRQDEAALSVAPLGMEAYVPGIVRFRKRGHVIVEEEQPRFGNYIFVRFDRALDPWGDLLRGRGPVNSYFKRFLSDPNPDGFPIPVPVPERAIQAIMAYQPPKIGQIIVPVYVEGQQVMRDLGNGTKVECVFLEYVGKGRSRVKTWMFGKENTVTVSASDLEPVEAVAA